MNFTVTDMILSAGPMAKAVLLLLLIFSVVSWAIIAHKAHVFHKLRKEAATFLEVFYDHNSLSTIYNASQRHRTNPFASLFIAGYQELRHVQLSESGGESRSGLADSEADKHTISSLKPIERAVRKAITLEINKLESSLGFLATTGSTAPFIGLFGTGWGVMNSFRGIGLRGSASLATVAPGISEALIATAAGLAAAIPAVAGYNYFVGRSRSVASEMENFLGDFLLYTEREFLLEDAAAHKDA